ncbi:MAG: tetratricopeptide repeat protein [Nitrospirota bacterium]
MGKLSLVMILSFSIFMGGNALAKCTGNIFNDVNPTTVSPDVCDAIERFYSLSINEYEDETFRLLDNTNRVQAAIFYVKAIDNMLNQSIWNKINNRVLTLYQQGEYPKAARVAEESLKIAEAFFGVERSWLAAEMKPLCEQALVIADLYRSQGKFAEAEPLYSQGLKIDEKALGKDHPDVARDLNNLAELYRAQGRYSEAEPLYKQALSIREKTLGIDHPEVATILNNLAELYQAQGRLEEAKPLLVRATSIREKEYKHDPQIATAPENISHEKNETANLAQTEQIETGLTFEKVGSQRKATEERKEIKRKSSKSEKKSVTIFTVQVGAFRNVTSAKTLKSRLDEKGYDTYITLSGSKEGERLYKVYIGIFVARNKAEALSEKIRNRDGIKAFVTSI